MAKQYRIDIILNNARALSAARATAAAFGQIDMAAQRAARSMQQATGQAAQQAVQTRRASANQINQIEDRLFLRDYQRRVAAARRAEQESARSAGRAAEAKQRDAARLASIEDRMLMRDYSRRVAFEGRKAKDDERATARAAELKNREAERLTGIEDRMLMRDYGRRVAHERRKEQEAARAAQKAVDVKNREAERIAAIEDRATLRDYNRRVALERRKEREAERATQAALNRKQREAAQLQRIEERFQRREYRNRVMQERRDELRQDAMADQNRNSTAGYVGGATVVAIAAATTALGYFNEQIDRVREKALEGAASIDRMRQSLRPDAALKGEPQANNRILKENLALRMASGLNQQEASDFERQYEGSIPIGLEKFELTKGQEGISEKVAGELKAAAALRARRVGGDAYTHGELAGLLGQFGPVKSAEQGLGQLEAIRIGLTKGRGDDTPLTRQLLKASGAMVREGGSVGTLPEMAALIGVTSLSAGPEEAGTRAEQLNRAFRSGLTRHTKGRGIKVPQAEYLKKQGIGEKDTLETMLDKVVPDLKKAEDKGRDLDVYLGERGFRSFEERRAIIETYRNYDAFKLRMREMREAQGIPTKEDIAAGARPGGKPLGAKEMAANEAFKGSTEGRRAIAEAVGDTNQVRQDLKGERWAALLKEAEASAAFQKEERDPSQGTYDIGEGIKNGHITDAKSEGRRLRIKGHAYRILAQRAKKAGITRAEEDKVFSEAMGDGNRSALDVDQDFANKIEAMIQAKTGNAGNAIDTRPALEKLTAEMERLRKQFEKMGGGNVPPALPPAPKGGAVRP